MTRRARFFVSRWPVLLAALGAWVAGPANSSPWATMAGQDLRAIHDTLAVNHPGPVDHNNRRYAEWLTSGLQAALNQAAGARTYGDYTRALRSYVNGFRDGHIALGFTMSSALLSWPGFIIAPAGNSRLKVVFAAADSGVPDGAELLSCDDRTVEALIAERLDPYFWNRDIPHSRLDAVANLFILQPNDVHRRFLSCSFRIGGGVRNITLSWRDQFRSEVLEALDRSEPSQLPLGISNVEGIWLVSIPSFAYFGEGAGPMKSLVSELKRRAPELRSGTVVFDVRGNGGGNSYWGRQIAAALWGEPLVRRVESSFDWTVDWRVSSDNVAHLERTVAQNERAGLTEAAASWRTALEGMRRAQARGETYLRINQRPARFRGMAPPSQFSGRAYLLTDGRCASACLDFADILRRLPNTIHVGLPTSADAIYIDNTAKLLPSGLANFSYSLKVYRNRIRGNNEWYQPQIEWPGGAMTTEAVISWIQGLEDRDGRRRPGGK